MTFVDLERIPVFTPFGIRFHDPALDEQVRQGLQVRVWPASARRPVRTATRTRSDVYAFFGLPGLRDVENGEVSSGGVSPSLPFVVHVVDLERRFLEVAFRVELPLDYRGVFLSRCPTSPELGVRGFLLLSAATRRAVSWMATVRGNLVDMDASDPANPDARIPASHAMVRVRTSDGGVYYGAADAAGAFRVVLPYPAFTGGFGGSPVVAGETPIDQREWPIEVDVHYEPARTAPLPGLEVPDYCELLQQAQSALQLDSLSPPATAVAAWQGDLRFGRELVVRTGGQPELWVRAASSNP